MNQTQLINKAKEYEQNSYKFSEMAEDDQWTKEAQDNYEQRATNNAQSAAIYYWTAMNMRFWGWSFDRAIDEAIMQVRGEMAR